MEPGPVGAGPGGPAEVRRTRALAVLSRRWEVPVTTVVAAGGFGKSTALRQAVAENRRVERGIDHLVGCRPFDAAADALGARLLAALGSPAPDPGDDPVEVAGAVVGALSALSPQPACVIVDDVHELGDDSPAAEVLNVLVRSLPANGHLVLCGRRLPSTLGLARLRAADGLVEVGDDVLGFDDDELRALRHLHGPAPAEVADLGRWPALVRLSLTAGRRASMEFLRQELLDDLDAAARRALGVATLARGADATLLADLGCRVTPAELAALVPLVDLDEDGVAVPHALWRDVVDQLIPPADAGEVLGAIGAHLAHAGAHDDAVAVLARGGHWDGVADVVLDSLRGGDTLVGRGQAVRWLRQIPEAERERPEVLVLRGLVARLTAFTFRDPLQRDAEFFGTDALSVERVDPDPDALFRRAEEHFAEEGRADGQAVALIAQLWRAWDETDREAMARLRRQITDLDHVAPGAAGPFPRIAGALVAALDGDLGDALDVLDEVRRDQLDAATRVFVELQRSGLAILHGDGELALEADRAALAAAEGQVDSEANGHDLVMSWLAGDPGPALRAFDVAAPIAVRSPQNRFRGVVYVNALAASFGPAEPVDVDALREQGTGSPRDDVFVTVAAAASHTARGEDEEAAALIRAEVAAHGTDDPVVAAELRRFLTYPYVLVPELRGWFDEADLGPTHRRARALGRLVVAVREDGTPRWDDLPPPPTVLAWLPLPWSVALAVAAHAAGRAAGLELIGYLLDTTGDLARNALRAAVARDRRGPAATLLAVVPAPPDTPVALDVLGPLRIRRGGEAVEVPELSRRRVRELLALLALRDEVTREAVMLALWPDLDAARARNNLNVTVRHLRTALEPDRRAGEAPFVLRTSGDLLRLHPSAHLGVDLWEVRRHLGRARQHERQAQVTEALVDYRAAAELWRGAPLADLARVDDLAPEVVAIERDLVDGTCRGAELAVAARDLDAARLLAERVLAHDPLEERAHRALLAAALAAGDTGRARATLARAEQAMAEAGVGLSAETLMLARQVGRDDPPEG